VPLIDPVHVLRVDGDRGRHELTVGDRVGPTAASADSALANGTDTAGKVRAPSCTSAACSATNHWRQTDADEWELFYGPVLLGYVLRRNGVVRIEPLR
jgi:hypothetical protein